MAECVLQYPRRKPLQYLIVGASVPFVNNKTVTNFRK